MLQDVRKPRMTSRQRLTAVVLLGASFMLSVDFSILNVALPQVGAELGFGVSSLAWISTAYALPAAGFTLLFGRIADLCGRRRIFLTGIALLAIASTLGGLSTGPVHLLAARGLQGFACALSIPAGLALLITSFDDQRLRAKVLGLNGALGAGGFTVGALLGGTIVGTLGWRWAFLVNVPLAVLVLVVTPFVVRASRSGTAVRLDIPGALTVTLGLLSLAFGVTNHSPYAASAGVVLLVLFWFVELRAKAPLAAVGILSRPSVKWGTVAGVALFGTVPPLVFLMTLYLQEVLHLSAIGTGLAFGVPGLGAVAAGVLGGRFVNRYGARRVMVAGLLIKTVFGAPLVLLGTGGGWLWLVIPALLIGFFGFITGVVASVVTVSSGMADDEQGLATGLTTLAQEIGPTLGVPVFSALVATRAALLAGLHLALAVNVAITLVAAVAVGLRKSVDAGPAGS